MDFTTPLALEANTLYWIGMSGFGFDLKQMGLNTNFPDDSMMFQFTGEGPSGGFTSHNVGDMAFRLHTPLDVTVPFSEFSISEAKIEYGFDTSINDSFASSGEFTLSLGSSGIDPCNEDVVVTLGTFSVTIPGSFVQEDEKFIFEGLIDGANIYMKIEEIAANTFTFVVEADGVDFTGTENPTFIELLISDDYGSADMRLDGELEYKGVK